MRRRLFTLAVGLSAVLCVAAAVLEWHSMNRLDCVTRAAWGPEGGMPARIWTAGSDCGSMFVTYERSDRLFPPLQAVYQRSFPPGIHVTSIESAGWTLNDPFEFDLDRRQDVQATQQRFEARAPGWAVILTTAVLPALWSFHRLTRRRPHGLCPACGYDLRATPGRCPECGTAAPTQSSCRST